MNPPKDHSPRPLRDLTLPQVCGKWSTPIGATKEMAANHHTAFDRRNSYSMHMLMKWEDVLAVPALRRNPAKNAEQRWTMNASLNRLRNSTPPHNRQDRQGRLRWPLTTSQRTTMICLSNKSRCNQTLASQALYVTTSPPLDKRT